MKTIFTIIVLTVSLSSLAETSAQLQDQDVYNCIYNEGTPDNIESVFYLCKDGTRLVDVNNYKNLYIGGSPSNIYDDVEVFRSQDVNTLSNGIIQCYFDNSEVSKKRLNLRKVKKACRKKQGSF
jgi:hypothetical protein